MNEIFDPLKFAINNLSDNDRGLLSEYRELRLAGFDNEEVRDMMGSESFEMAINVMKGSYFRQWHWFKEMGTRCCPASRSHRCILKEAQDLGIQTWISCEPVIDPAQTLNLIETTCNLVDFFGLGSWTIILRSKQRLIGQSSEMM